HRRRQFAQVAEQYLAMLIEFANNPRTPLQRHIVKLPGELVLDNASLLLHYQDLVQALSEIPGSDRLQWPGHSHLEDANAQSFHLLLIDAQVIQRLEHI